MGMEANKRPFEGAARHLRVKVKKCPFSLRCAAQPRLEGSVHGRVTR